MNALKGTLLILVMIGTIFLIEHFKKPEQIKTSHQVKQETSRQTNQTITLQWGSVVIPSSWNEFLTFQEEDQKTVIMIHNKDHSISEKALELQCITKERSKQLKEMMFIAEMVPQWIYEGETHDVISYSMDGAYELYPNDPNQRKHQEKDPQFVVIHEIFDNLYQTLQDQISIVQKESGD